MADKPCCKAAGKCKGCPAYRSLLAGELHVPQVSDLEVLYYKLQAKALQEEQSKCL